MSLYKVCRYKWHAAAQKAWRLWNLWNLIDNVRLDYQPLFAKWARAKTGLEKAAEIDPIGGLLGSKHLSLSLCLFYSISQRAEASSR